MDACVRVWYRVRVWVNSPRHTLIQLHNTLSPYLQRIKMYLVCLMWVADRVGLYSMAQRTCPAERFTPIETAPTFPGVWYVQPDSKTLCKTWYVSFHYYVAQRSTWLDIVIRKMCADVTRNSADKDEMGVKFRSQMSLLARESNRARIVKSIRPHVLSLLAILRRCGCSRVWALVTTCYIQTIEGSSRGQSRALANQSTPPDP